MKFVALLLLLALPAPAFARARQKPPEPPPVLAEGSRVRVTLLARKTPTLRGWALAVRADSLLLASEPQLDSVAIGRPDIKKLELSRGMHSNSGTGAAIGALVLGVCLGLSVTAVASVEGSSNDAVVAGVGGAIVGALAGAGIGALIGSASKHEEWVEVRKQ